MLILFSQIFTHITDVHMGMNTHTQCVHPETHNLKTIKHNKTNTTVHYCIASIYGLGKKNPKNKNKVKTSPKQQHSKKSSEKYISKNGIFFFSDCTLLTNIDLIVQAAKHII